MTATLTRSPSELASATPARRDRYVDFLRAASLAVVMFGHWLMAAVVWADGSLQASNVLEEAPAARYLTWVFQVMPLFFVVGGFSNAASLAAARRDGVGYGTWLGGRLTRLLRPVLAFAVVWTLAAVALRLFGADPAALRAGSIAQPIWFLAVYVVVVAAAPAMVAAHRRWGAGVAVGLGGAVALVDVARWGFGVPLVGWLNLALVWLFAHQLGVPWREGVLAGWSRTRLLALAAAGLGGMVVLTQGLGFATSMVGGTGEARSNTFPPSLAMVALAVWQFGAALAVRPVVDRWLARPRAWATVVTANGLAMTIYLWHLTAMLVVAALTLPAGLLPEPPTGSAAWWVWRPVWLVLCAAAGAPRGPLRPGGDGSGGANEALEPAGGGGRIDHHGGHGPPGSQGLRGGGHARRRPADGPGSGRRRLVAAEGVTVRGDGSRVMTAVALIVGLSLLAAHNLLVERLPAWAYVPAGLTTTGVLLALAGGAGADWEELGLSPSNLPVGLGAGAAIGVVVALVVAGAALAPRTRLLFADQRMAGVGPWGTACRAAVRIPLGTVVLEEVAFRGVLVALLAPLMSMAGAVAMASVLFGLWHLVPTNATLDRNQVALSRRARRQALAGAVLFTTVVGVAFCGLRLVTGSLLAPALVHLSANASATVAAFVVLRHTQPAGVAPGVLSVDACGP